MTKVITYGTYDLLHYGHIRLLERAKALGDYLIVGVTSDDFDKARGKINVRQSLMERIEGVKATGLADEIIVEEYEGQKIDDISRFDIDIFTVGSDWKGKFDYLDQYCTVVYLERTEGVSSTKIREEKNIRIGLLGNAVYLNKVAREIQYVNGMKLCGLCSDMSEHFFDFNKEIMFSTDNFHELLNEVDAVYVYSTPEQHYRDIFMSLEKGKHVICESPLTLDAKLTKELFIYAKEKGCVLQEALKTAYSVAYSRMLLLIKSGRIGDVVSIDVTCTSLNKDTINEGWNGVTSWGPVAVLPIFQIFGTDYLDCEFTSIYDKPGERRELMTNIKMVYPRGIATVKVGQGIKSEGELIISGTKGYIYVPAPWWKTEYFEIRYENLADTKKYFYQLDGEGIRNEFVSFTQNIRNSKSLKYIDQDISVAISRIMEEYRDPSKVRRINLGD